MLLPPLIALMLASGAACSFLWIGAEIGRRTSVKGSQPRYVWASIERGLRYPALMYFSISAAVEAAIYKDWFLFASACAGVALWLVLWQQKKRDGEDDDFWTNLRKKFQSWAASHSPAVFGAGA